MSIKNNQIYLTAMQFVEDFPKGYPETFLCGIAELLMMDEGKVRLILGSDKIAELESVRRVFESFNLDPKLVRQGLRLCIPYLPDTDQTKEQRAAFQSDVESETLGYSMAQMVRTALTRCYVPVLDIYVKSSSYQKASNYYFQLKKLHAGSAKPDTGKQDGKKADDKKPDEEKVDDKGDARIGDKTGTKKTPSSPGSILDKLMKASGEKQAGSETGQASQQPESSGDKFTDVFRKYHSLTSKLLSVVRGQDAAVLKFVQGCYQGELLWEQEKETLRHPRAFFFFFGPPGVGKTFLAETASREMMKKEAHIYNMAEYTSAQSHEDLIGISKFYKDAREGILFKDIAKDPDGFFVFDEIEKANKNVIRLFLQMLGSGRMYNVFKEENTDFRNATVIFTSNAAKSLYSDMDVKLSTLPPSVLISALRSEKDDKGEQIFPDEMCSRLATGNTIVFDHLSTRMLNDMVNDEFEKKAKGIEDKYGIHVTFTDEISQLFLYTLGRMLDARIATVQSGNFLKKEMYDLAMQIENLGKSGSIRNVRYDIDWASSEEELRGLFKRSGGDEVLFLVNEDRREILKSHKGSEKLHAASSAEEAAKYLKRDLAAIFVDPIIGRNADQGSPMSLADYDTEGMHFLHMIEEKNSGVPVYVLQTEREFTDIDRSGFMQEGVDDIVRFEKNQTESFFRHFDQIMEELYMDRQRNEFSRKGWVIDYRTKQESGEDGDITIYFYDLRKRMAVEADSRDAIMSDYERPDVKFDDVIGAENAKKELKYFTEYLKNPKHFLLSDGKPPKGVLLYGPPGTGKTMLAKAMAGESEVSFLATSATEFMNSLVGGSESNIRKIFATARQYAPAVIFIDEIDAIGKQRTGDSNKAHTETMLNALLTEMDGFSSSANVRRPVLVIAATNYGVGAYTQGISSLDEALLRRFDNKIYVDLPNRDERRQYLEKFLKKRKAEQVSQDTINNIADRTFGDSLATLENVLELAFRNASRAGRKVTDADLLTALEDFVYGEKREMTQEYYREVAIHETGHALISYLCGVRPSYITIESRSHFGGYMLPEAQEKGGSRTKADLTGKIRMTLAGRASEIVFFGKNKGMNSGASSDLEHATSLAFAMISTYGMMDGQFVVLSREEILRSSLAAEYVAQVNQLLQQEMAETIRMIEENKALVQKIADELVTRTHLTGEEFEAIVNNS